jgi:hypothetical protein
MPITTTPSGGAQGEFSTYTPIYSQTLASSGAASFTVSNIPTNYTDLLVVLNAKDSRTGNSDSLTVQFNGDTGSNYSNTDLTGNGTTAASSRYSSQNFVRIGDVAGASASEYGTTVFHILNYSNTTTYKTLLGIGGIAVDFVEYRAGLWRSTAPITSITFLAQGGIATWTSGSTFTIYGIKAATPPPKATGGDVITTDGTYWYHAFKNSGVFSLTSSVSSLTADVLVVAGGGGGGAKTGAGGGAGGFLGLTSQTLSVTNHTVTVGAGGAGGFPNLGGASGSNSQLGSLTAAVGGGAGAGRNGGNGSNGGSGGGQADNQTPAYTGTTGQGNSGGLSGSQTGGGGGAGAAGGTGGSSTAGAGGIGLNTYSSWASATSTGASGYYAGGGGGSVEGQFGVGASGGTGGGGSGSTNAAVGTGNTGGAGTVNTGGGGGGAGFSGGTTVDVGGAGGSGIVIVRYAV